MPRTTGAPSPRAWMRAATACGERRETSDAHAVVARRGTRDAGVRRLQRARTGCGSRPRPGAAAGTLRCAHRALRCAFRPWPLLPAAWGVRSPAAARAGLDKSPERALLLLGRSVVCAARATLRRGTGSGWGVCPGAAGVLHHHLVCRLLLEKKKNACAVPLNR